MKAAGSVDQKNVIVSLESVAPHGQVTTNAKIEKATGSTAEDIVQRFLNRSRLTLVEENAKTKELDSYEWN